MDCPWRFANICIVSKIVVFEIESNVVPVRYSKHVLSVTPKAETMIFLTERVGIFLVPIENLTLVFSQLFTCAHMN